MIYGFLFGGFLLALAIIIWPLWRYGNNIVATGTENIDVFKAQLRELETDIQSGLLTGTEAASAKLEIERRILRTAGEDRKLPVGKTSLNLLITVSLLILLGCVAFYLTRGMPEMGGSPLNKQKLQQQTQESPKNAPENTPENAKDWRTLGQYYTSRKMRAEAASAFQHWYELDPDNIDAAVTFGESLIMLANGRVGPAASLVMRRVRQIQPRNPAVRHYLALEQYQAGNIKQALSQWQALEAGSTADAPWLGQLRLWIGRAQRDLGLTAPQDTSSAPAISAEQRQAISQMSADEQTAMIKNMVGRLQEKMEQNPQNIEGWLRLAQAYMVLGDREKAVKALKQAEKYAPDDLKETLKKQLESLEK